MTELTHDQFEVTAIHFRNKDTGNSGIIPADARVRFAADSEVQPQLPDDHVKKVLEVVEQSLKQRLSERIRNLMKCSDESSSVMPSHKVRVKLTGDGTYITEGKACLTPMIYPHSYLVESLEHVQLVSKPQIVISVYVHFQVMRTFTWNAHH